MDRSDRPRAEFAQDRDPRARPAYELEVGTVCLSKPAIPSPTSGAVDPHQTGVNEQMVQLKRGGVLR